MSPDHPAHPGEPEDQTERPARPKLDDPWDELTAEEDSLDDGGDDEDLGEEEANDDEIDEAGDNDEEAEDLELESFPEQVEAEPRTVLITGASGNIGRKLRSAWADVYNLVLIDKNAPDDDPDVIAADLSVLDDEWITHFHGVDTVVHLAANGDEFAGWDELIAPNLDALANVFHAAASREWSG